MIHTVLISKHGLRILYGTCPFCSTPYRYTGGYFKEPLSLNTRPANHMPCPPITLELLPDVLTINGYNRELTMQEVDQIVERRKTCSAQQET